MILSLLLAGMGTVATAQNINLPIIQTKYTADPAPYVHNDTVYLYTTHDEDGAEGFLMKDWLLYTSTDMVNWQDRGAVASLKDFKWFKGENGAWAEQVIERNGKWYMYCPIHGHGIGVLVADNPFGPFKDPLGKPLAWEGDWFDIDPTVWIDDDNQAYMYWGNPELKAVKLNEDMISYSDSIMHFPKIQDYQEGPWLWKRNGNYYLAYASTCCPEGIGYAMSKNPLGPWEYKGHIMNHTTRTRGNHPGKEADCSVAMAAGSDAARNVAEIVLVDNDFASMPAVVAEGRRSINNLQRSAALFLTKTLLSMGLAALCIAFPPYPFEPIQMTLINFFCIGAPGFVLGLEPNNARVKGSFLTNVLKRALPASLAVIMAAALDIFVARVFGFNQLTTMPATWAAM